MPEQTSMTPGASFNEPEQPPRQPRIVNSKDLFEGDKEVCIDHKGAVYRLKLTRQDKLILNK